MKLKLKLVLTPGTGFGKLPIGTLVDVDENKVVKTESGDYGIVNPAWDSKFEKAVHRPMPKYSVIFEAI